MATKTFSMRLNEDDYKFLYAYAKEEKEDVSKAVRELLDRGRVMLAIEKYRKSEASIEKAARIAGVSVSRMMDIFQDHGVESNMEFEDYLKGLKNLRKVW